MYIAFIFKQGKLFPAFNGSQYASVEKLKQSVGWYYESKRGDQSTQFVVVKDDRIVHVINKEMLDETQR